MKAVAKTWGIIRPDRLKKIQSKRLSTGEQLGLLADVAGAADLDNIQIHQEILLPGRRSSPQHRHTHRIEIVFVLGGSPCVKLNFKSKRLKAGEFVVFSPRDNRYHMIFNDCEEKAKLLVISFDTEGDEVVYMPEQLELFEND